MTIEEKEDKITSIIKLKLDEIDYRITSIISYYSENRLLRDGTYKNVIVTSFTEPLLDLDTSIITDSETLEMLYVWTGPMRYMEIENFFTKH
ncbi:hypothetical protein SAMN05421786_107175 [Chryseobacterium ureilyticum]|uniref:Uncharacterized protein n=1 Tax=Chryseobacterium ureilyticum TaxID=373668 RepID=A0A1N7Q4C0_9FLAO|nr:hypothetical protein [Chryseobacterium ureilyticum]SIT17447.1 hypothetical protein SAMN05421786_107175 [Chryseobacterium ureilyticum]